MTKLLDKMDYLSLGKRVRLHRLMYEHGPGNGHMMFLPIDQGMEHGPVDFFPNPPSANPEFQFNLAKEVNFSGIALHLGLAEKYATKYAGRVPIVLKINGKTRIPSDSHALSPMTASVEDAVRIGADAIGYTLYIGSPSQVADFTQFRKVKADADRYGMPVIMWAYPRGEAIEKKGGRNSLYAVDYAARLAAENHESKDLIPLEKKMKEFKICLETKDSDKLHKINTQFHDLLYSLSKSPKLIKMINQLRAQISRFRQIILKQNEYAHKSNEDHIKMLDAIKNRDGKKVEQLVRQHIIKGKNAVLSELAQEEEEKKSA